MSSAQERISPSPCICAAQRDSPVVCHAGSRLPAGALDDWSSLQSSGLGHTSCPMYSDPNLPYLKSSDIQYQILLGERYSKAEPRFDKAGLEHILVVSDRLTRKAPRRPVCPQA